MKNWMKIILPLLGIAYFIAFLEIDLPGVHQTWDDPYDTYVVTQQYAVHSEVQHADVKISYPASVRMAGLILPRFRLFFILILPVFLLYYNSSGLYLKNCTFRI